MNDESLEKFSNFVIFQTATGKVNIDVYFQDETLWLTQKKIAELFEKGRSTITEHLKNIFLENELDEDSVCRDFRHTAEDGKTYNITMGMINHERHEKHEKNTISNFCAFRVFRGSRNRVDNAE